MRQALQKHLFTVDSVMFGAHAGRRFSTFPPSPDIMRIVTYAHVFELEPTHVQLACERRVYACE